MSSTTPTAGDSATMAALRALLDDAGLNDTNNGTELDLITKLRAIVNTDQGGGGTSKQKIISSLDLGMSSWYDDVIPSDPVLDTGHKAR